MLFSSYYLAFNLVDSNANEALDLGHFSNVEMNDFNWLPQTDFQFDPQLFGDYRDPQENVLSIGIDDSFFNDAFDVDFTTPYNMPVTGAPKKDILAEIEAAKNADELGTNGQLLTCNKIWSVPSLSETTSRSFTDKFHRERLQSCPKVQNWRFRS